MFASVAGGSLRLRPRSGKLVEKVREGCLQDSYGFGLAGGIPVPQDPASRAAVVAPWPTKKKFSTRHSPIFTAPGRTSRAGDRGPGPANISAKHRNPGGHVKPPARIVLDLGRGFLKRRLFGLEEVTKLTRPAVEKR
jgi:hypothetical protein